MGRAEGKVALITGAGRGQVRSHAIRLAEEGADIIAIDVLEDVATVPYKMACQSDMDATVEQVEALDRRIIAHKADVRDLEALKEIAAAGAEAFGHIDVVCANAGVITIQPWDEVTPRIWQETLDINLTGVWNTLVATIPHLIDNGGGSIICTASTAGVMGLPLHPPYVAAKFGVVGLARAMANDLAEHKIRVNTVIPTGTATPMAQSGGPRVQSLLDSHPNVRGVFKNALQVELIEARDVSNVVLFLASDEARYVTGADYKVDAGFTAR
jgi:SDR family mycofactocin-dependent oxidoreductase